MVSEVLVKGRFHPVYFKSPYLGSWDVDERESSRETGDLCIVLPKALQGVEAGLELSLYGGVWRRYNRCKNFRISVPGPHREGSKR